MLSVVIPSLHSPGIGRAVAALQRQTAADQIGEIIVVGLDRHGLVPPEAHFIPTGWPLPAAAARNLGARHASSDVLLFVDSDCVAAPDLAERMLVHHRAGRAAIGGSVAPGQGYWRRCDDLLVFAESHPSAQAGPRAALPSCNLCIGRELFLQLGGFDERFPGAAGEDFDLSVRLREAGYELYFEPRARVEHHHGRTSPQDIWQHLRAFGRAHARIARTRPSLRGSGAARLPRRLAGMLTAAALPLACLDVARLSAGSPALRREPLAWPGMVWARTGWYWGLAEGLLAAP